MRWKRVPPRAGRSNAEREHALDHTRWLSEETTSTFTAAGYNTLLLDLDRADVLAARDDDDLAAVLDLHAAIRRHHREVASAILQDQPGTMFAQFVTNLYQQNRLIKGELEIGGKRVQLKHVRQPVFNVYATEDHLVPPAASNCLKQYVGSKDYTELAFAGGHIGIYVSSKAQREIPAALATWLQRYSGT